MKATSATTIVATFESALPADAVLTLTKGTVDTGVKATIDEARTTATFKADSKYQPGTYTVTATAGESKQSKDVEITAESVQDIVVKSKTALTDSTKTKLYVYYDVLNQYGESMRTSTSITWSSGAGEVKADKSTGCLTITKSATDKTQFTYGTNIYLVGVDIKSGKSVQASLPVGMERALDSIKFEGFINVDDKGTILETLPKDFAAGKYRLLFTAYDQEGNEMEADKAYTASSSPKVTFTANNPTLIKAEFKQGDIYTIKSKKYCSVTVEPGMYVDKGGEVTITAISNTTGKTTAQNFVIGAGAVLQSLVLSAPTVTVADGDTWVNIPYVAKDTNGNEITNYETIVRSTNSLKLTASAGTLTVYETASGAAAIRWDDTTNNAGDFTASSSYDGIDRPISLVTTVIGGESNNVMMNVSDTRRPVAVSSVKLNGDNNDTIAESNSTSIPFFGEDDVKYVDQYGAVLDNWKAKAFFEQAATGFNGHKYGVKVDYSTVQDIVVTNNAVCEDGKYTVLQADGKNNKLELSSKSLNGSKSASVDNIKYSVVKLEDKSWDVVDAEKSVDYTIVPVSKLSNLRINDIAKVRIDTDYSDYANADGMSVASGSAVALNPTRDAIAEVATPREVIVAGTYDGKTVTIPRTFYDVSDKVNTTFKVENCGWSTNALINGLIDSATASAIKYSDLYDFNTAKNTRKDAKKDVLAKVYKVANNTDKDNLLGTVKTSVTVSDAPSAPAKIVFSQYWAIVDKLEINANATVYDFSTIGKLANWWETSWGPAVKVTDQYGDVIQIADPNATNANDNKGKVSVEFSVTNINENAGEFAHLSKSFAVNRNNSDVANLDGIEIKDTFDLTATVAGTNVSAKAAVTVGADVCAYIDSTGKDEPTNVVNPSDSNKKLTLRDILGYNR